MHQRHSAGCFAATAVRPDGQGPRDKLVAEFEPSHRSVYSAETDDRSLVIGELEATNSRSNRLGRVCGHCALTFEATNSASNGLGAIAGHCGAAPLDANYNEMGKCCCRRCGEIVDAGHKALYKARRWREGHREVSRRHWQLIGKVDDEP